MSSRESSSQYCKGFDLSDLLRLSDGSVPPLNMVVLKRDNLFKEKLTSGEAHGIEGLAINTRFPVRPGYGWKGRKVIIYAKSIQVLPNPTLILYRYEVAVSPEVIGRKLIRIFKLLLELPALIKSRNAIVTDYKSTLITNRKLGAVTFQVVYRGDGEDEPLPHAQTYQVHIEPKDTFPVSDLTNYLSSTSVNTAYTDKLEVVQALNIFLRHHAKSHPNITTSGGSKSFTINPNTPRRDL